MLARTIAQNGWTLGFEREADEPRIRDLDLAERLGFERPRDIRKLVERLQKKNSFGVCATVAQTSSGVGGRPAVEYWLTEPQALKVIAKSETAKADAILDEVIAVFIAYRRGLLAARPALLDGTVANSARVEDDPASKERLRLAVVRVCRARPYSIQRVYGYIRKTQRLASPFALSLHLLDAVVSGLEQIEQRHVSLLTRKEEREVEARRRAAEKQIPFGGKGWN